MMKFFQLRLICLLLLSLPALSFAQGGEGGAPRAAPTPGMEGLVENLVLPGSELEPKTLENTNSPIVLRVVQVFPHVDDWRYDLSFYGLVPGKYDLREFLQRKDGSGMEGVPPIPVEIVPIRDLNELVRPALELEKPPRVGGYKLALIAAGVFWVGVLGLLIFGFRKKTEEQLAQRVKPVTLADVLRPLVKKAQSGELSQAGQAELERTLLGIWRKRLKMEDDEPAEAIIKLRQHEEAGALLRELEKWLHRPGTADDVDVAALLKPYEKLPAEES
jgi:hypothetical protein